MKGKNGLVDYAVSAAYQAGRKGTDWLMRMAANQNRSQVDRDVAARAAALCEAQG